MNIRAFSEAFNQARTARLAEQIVRLDPTLLDLVTATGPHADALVGLTVGDLLAAATSEARVLAEMRRLASCGVSEVSSQRFCEVLGCERWHAQELLADMANRGVLVRMGRTSGTRYSLP